MAKTGCNRASFLKDLAHEGSQTAIKELQPTECSLVSFLSRNSQTKVLECALTEKLWIIFC
jgi:hypothetical protein